MVIQEHGSGEVDNVRCSGLQHIVNNLMARCSGSGSSGNGQKMHALEDEIETLRARMAELEQDLDTQRDLKAAFRVQAVRLGQSLKQVRELASSNGVDLRSIEVANSPYTSAGNGQVNGAAEAQTEEEESEDTDDPESSGSKARQRLRAHGKDFGWLLDRKQLKLGEKIGSGSTADIFKAEWRGLDVAVKCLRPKNFHSNGDAEALYLREVEVLSRQHHPYVLHMYAASLSIPNYAWIVTDLMAAGTLSEWLHGTKERVAKRTAPLPPLCERLRVATEVSTAMQFLNERSPKVVHRDLKPSNVFMDKHGHVRVADFSFARYFPKEGVLSGETGTYVYMAPEVMRHDHYDEKCDVYSFGVMLYEIVTGIHPYVDKPYSPAQIALSVAIGHLRPALPGGLNHNLALKKLIQACWGQDPAKRPSFAEITLQLKCIEKDPKEVVDTSMLQGSRSHPHGYFSGLLFKNG